MLAEVEHRTANDLALAVATLQIARRSVPVGHRAEIDGAITRLHQQAAVSRLLLPPLDDEAVDFGAALRKLGQGLSAIRLEPEGITLAVHVDDLELPARTNWMVLVIVAELVLNAAKHAFRRTSATDGLGSVAVMTRIEHGSLILRVGDDGVGHLDGVLADAGQGSTILGALVRTLGADLRHLPTKMGTTIEIVVPLMR